MNFYLGQWQWVAAAGNAAAYWAAPAGTVAAIDLRPTDKQGPGPVATGQALFVVDPAFAGGATPDATFLNFGTDPDAVQPAARITAWRNRLNIAAAMDGNRLSQILAETLTDKSDPTGAARARPLSLSRAGTLDVHAGAGGILSSRPFGGAADVAWPRMQAVERGDYRAVRTSALAIAAAFDAAQPGDGTPWSFRCAVMAARQGVTFADARAVLATAAREKFRRYLGLLLLKYRAWNFGVPDVVPADLLADADPLDPQTTLTDAFTDADATNVTAHTAGGFSWAVVQGTAVITGNTLDASNFFIGRADSALSSADHYAQADVTNSSHQSDGVNVRQASSGFVRYSVINYFNTCQAAKYDSSNTETRFANDFTNPGTNYTIKADVNGSTVKGFVGGSQRFSVTDTTITGNLYAGINLFWGSDNDTRFDNFQASDGLGGGVTATVGVTLADVTASGAGVSFITGAVGKTLDNVTAVSAGVSFITGATARTLADVTGAASGVSFITGATARTLDNVTAAATGVVAGGPVLAMLAKVLDNVVAAAQAVSRVVALGGGVLADIVLQSTGVVSDGEPPPPSGGDVYVVRTTAAFYGWRTVPAG